MNETLKEAKVTALDSSGEGMQILTLEVNGEEIIIEHNYGGFLNGQEFAKGDRIVISEIELPSGDIQVNAVDHVRRPNLILLFILFVVVVLFVNRKKGLLSLLSMGFSFLVLFVLVLPLILAGHPPVLVALLGAALMLPANFYLSHGINRKTTFAMIGTLLSLIVTGFLASIFSEMSHLTGLASEEAAFLFTGGKESIDFHGLVLAGIIIAVLGVLDDVCITQSSVVHQLKKTKPSIKFGEAFSRGMAVGQDHIASVVNTLILVYTGASLPLLLLFLDGGQSIGQVLNYEMVAEEVVRTLVGSIGLVLAVPITTALAAWSVTKGTGDVSFHKEQD